MIKKTQLRGWQRSG